MQYQEGSSTSVDSVDSNDLLQLLQRLGIERRKKGCETAKGTINDLLASSESDEECVAESRSPLVEQIHTKVSSTSELTNIDDQNDASTMPDVVNLVSDSEDDEIIEDRDWNIRSTTQKNSTRYVIDSDDEDDDEEEEEEESRINIKREEDGDDDDITAQLNTYITAKKEETQQPSSPSFQFPSLSILDRPPSSKASSKRHASFAKIRDSMARDLFSEYNTKVFNSMLPPNLEVTWNKRLATTAGLTHYRRETSTGSACYSARIELSCKVVDDEAKLKKTLMHEMCHAAAWLIDHVAKPPHGPIFKAWAQRAMVKYPSLDVSTCHQYEIFYAFQWQCNACNQIYGRHSNSIDVNKKVCGCRGRLVYLGKFKKDADGSPVKQMQRAPSAYSQFVKENFASVKKECDEGTLASEIMKEVSRKWSMLQEKENAALQS